MKFDAGNDGLILSTGKRLYAHCGIIGINPEGLLFNGYDSGLEDEKLNLEEKIELAEYAITLWKEYIQRNKHKTGFRRLRKEIING